MSLFTSSISSNFHTSIVNTNLMFVAVFETCGAAMNTAGQPADADSHKRNPRRRISLKVPFLASV